MIGADVAAAGRVATGGAGVVAGGLVVAGGTGRVVAGGAGVATGGRAGLSAGGAAFSDRVKSLPERGGFCGAVWASTGPAIRTDAANGTNRRRRDWLMAANIAPQP